MYHAWSTAVASLDKHTHQPTPLYPRQNTHYQLVFWGVIVDTCPGHVEVACTSWSHDHCMSDVGIPG